MLSSNSSDPVAATMTAAGHVTQQRPEISNYGSMAAKKKTREKKKSIVINRANFIEVK